MSSRRLQFAVLIVACLLSRPHGARGAGVEGELQGRTAALLAAVRDALTAVQQRLDAGKALTPTFFSLYCDVSRSLREAEAAAATDAAGPLHAAKQHLARVKDALEPGIDISDRDPKGQAGASP